MVRAFTAKMNLATLLWRISMIIGFVESFTRTDFDVVLSVTRYFNVAFCVIGRSENENDFGLVSGESHPSKRKLLTSSLSLREISNFLKGSSNALQNSGKTMIVMKMNEKVLEFLREISHSANLSFAVWVLFSEHHLKSEEFRRVYIPFDCQFVYVAKNESVFHMTEIYHIDKDSGVEKYDLGSWTRSRGLVLAGLHLYRRRNNLKGRKLKAIIKDHPPYVTIERDDDGNPKFRGYLYEIWSELQFRINFSTEFPDKYFDKDPVEVLKNNEVDFAVARISNEPSAYQHIDFSQPIDEAKSYLFGHRPGSELDWDSYLKPFGTRTWLVNLVWMLSSSMALAVLYKIAWNYGTSERESEYFIFTYWESFLTVFRAICMQGSDVTPRSISCRLLFLSIYLTALVVTSAFSAALFSLLTIPKPKPPFTSLDEVLSNRKYKIGLPADSDFAKTIEGFSDSLYQSKQNELFERLLEMKEKIPVSPEEGLRRLCHDRTYVFLFDLPHVLYLMQNMTRTCQDKILPSGPSLFTEFIGFGFKKNNPYKELIDYHLIRMKNEGILHRLLLNYWPPQIPTVQATWVRVTLSDISPILYMFALGAILGVIFLYAESVLIRLRKKNVNAGSSGVMLHNNLLLSTASKSEKTSTKRKTGQNLFFLKIRNFH